MKPPMIPRLMDPEDEAKKVPDTVEDSRPSVETVAKTEKDADPFKDFANVSKPEEPSELQLLRIDKLNNENE